MALYAIGYIFLVQLAFVSAGRLRRLFSRAHYGLATQNFSSWSGDQVKGLIVALILGPHRAHGALCGFPARAAELVDLGHRAWDSFCSSSRMLIAPIFIEPLFNTYKPLTDPKISAPILAMAAANEIPVHQVFEVDASRQSNRVSANVAGIFGTARIALNDNLLKQCTLPEIRAVMAHEMGHYVLNHSLKLMLYFGIFIFVGFALVNLFFDRCVQRWGERWGVRGIADPAGLPLLGLILCDLFFSAHAAAKHRGASDRTRGRRSSGSTPRAKPTASPKSRSSSALIASSIPARGRSLSSSIIRAAGRGSGWRWIGRRPTCRRVTPERPLPR